ncbi:MAG: thioredoxin domain-containing protein [Acidobacteria bacterium]|nr:thioredoxin domain-containing protein [Acidobacteriota bacterium]
MLARGRQQTCGASVCLLGFLLVQAGWVFFLPLRAEQTGASESKRLAVVSGATITEAQVQEAAKSDLEKLEVQRLQREAEYERNKQQVLEASLNGLIEEKLLDAEAAKRGVPKGDLLTKEVDSAVEAVSYDEVNNFYEANKAVIGAPKEQVAGQIQQYLQEIRRKEAYDRFIDGLKKEYGVESFLEPLRIHVETASHPSRGPAKAPVTIVEFSDFECPFCSRLVSTLKEVEKNYGDKVRLVYRQFPLSNHPHAAKAAEASLCADEQGRFWDMHDLLFQEQKALDLLDLKSKAASLKLDTTRFDECLNSDRYAEKVRQDVLAGSRAGVTGTPAMFINGRFISGAIPYEELAKVLDQELPKVADRK